MLSLIGNALYQWDIDRKIKVIDGRIKKVYFSDNHFCDPCEVEIADGVVTIPNKLLQNALGVNVFAYDENGEKVYSCKLATNGKMKPSDYNLEVEGPDSSPGGATAEQIAQIEKNKKAVEQLQEEIGDKLDSSELTNAVNNALTQAKESGLFDGEDGEDGQDGQDGYTPQKGVDYFDGEDGKDGYTPVKGIDYFTEADKQELVEAVYAQIADGNEVAY